MHNNICIFKINILAKLRRCVLWVLRILWQSFHSGNLVVLWTDGRTDQLIWVCARGAYASKSGNWMCCIVFQDTMLLILQSYYNSFEDKMTKLGWVWHFHHFFSLYEGWAKADMPIWWQRTIGHWQQICMQRWQQANDYCSKHLLVSSPVMHFCATFFFFFIVVKMGWRKSRIIVTCYPLCADRWDIGERKEMLLRLRWFTAAAILHIGFA